MSSTPKPVLCGTPGCTLKKGHLGLCSSNALVDASPASRRAAVAARQAERERGSERAAFQSPTAAKAPPKIHLRLSGTGEWRSEALAADTSDPAADAEAEAGGEPWGIVLDRSRLQTVAELDETGAPFTMAERAVDAAVLRAPSDPEKAGLSLSVAVALARGFSCCRGTLRRVSLLGWRFDGKNALRVSARDACDPTCAARGPTRPTRPSFPPR